MISSTPRFSANHVKRITAHEIPDEISDQEADLTQYQINLSVGAKTLEARLTLW